MTKDLAYYMSLPYKVVITPPDEDDEEWFADIIELPDCITHAETWEELGENIKIVKELWISVTLEDNNPVPEPEREPA
jgi:predicted RNase H-like HicB family nuclease